MEITNSFLIAPFQVKGHSSVLLHVVLYYCTVLSNDYITCVQWSIYFISPDPVLAN